MASPLIRPASLSRRRRSHHAYADNTWASPRRDSMASTCTFTSDVEMAQDEPFSGPISGSVPSSITGFASRRRRAESSASFTFFDSSEREPDMLNGRATPEDEDMDLPISRHNSHRHAHRAARHRESEDDVDPMEAPHVELGTLYEPLLNRTSSPGRSVSRRATESYRSSQKLHIVSEDLAIVIAGFKTRPLGYLGYVALCVVTLGIAYLVFRWLPRWKVYIIGCSTSLRDCSWTVVEDQYGGLTVQSFKRYKYGHLLSSVFGVKDLGQSYFETDDDEDPILSYLSFLDYRYHRIYYHPYKDILLLNNGWMDPSWTSTKAMRVGLENEDSQIREQVWGKNDLAILEKSIPSLIIDEVLHPFYIFQIASLILWSLDEYYYYAFCILMISLISITTTTIETHLTMKRLKAISLFACEVRVLRNKFWRQINSVDLVPGDVYEVSDPSLSQFPCDSLLLSGDCIVNESMLTGESLPVFKSPAEDASLFLLNNSADVMHPDLAKQFLFSGTKIIRARRPENKRNGEAVALAIVIRTGFNTTKGALVRSMLFPKPSGFKFYQDAFRYISVMAGIALVGFTASFVNFMRLGLSWHLIIVRALDLITIIVPPALPATLTIGTNFALTRLRHKNIFCISPQRVNVGGKLDIICFDKTGTLTEDGLDVLGVRVMHKTSMQFSEVIDDSSALSPGSVTERDPTVTYRIRKAILYAMATCHSLRVVDGEVIGDPLDLKMFDFTKWSLNEVALEQSRGVDDDQVSVTTVVISPAATRSMVGMDTSSSVLDQSPARLAILKSFEFVSQLRRASVIVGQFDQNACHIYVKGAPECMRDICTLESLPTDYDDLLTFHTLKGHRVIACATRKMVYTSASEIQKFTRKEAECDLEFLGFIIFENKLKDATIGTINELNTANIRSVMCTGDNILTAISVARECNLIDHGAHCFTPHFVAGTYLDPHAQLRWQSIDDPMYELDQKTLMPLVPTHGVGLSSPYDITNVRNYAIAMTGDVFRWMSQYASEDLLDRVLVRSQVFARMSPDEKHELVDKFQGLGYCCGFCGDGANDCGALKAADIGISLSEAEASVAAPFTSRVFDISCVPEIIREGRAALVTSFGCFKYMSLYSAIQFTTVSFLYASASNLGDFQFLFIDIFLVLPIAILMGWSGAYPKLCAKRPTASLVSRKILIPLLGQIILCIILQALGYFCVRLQTWYIPPVVNHERSNIENSENTVLFTISSFQYIYAGIILSSGAPYRQSMRHNLPFVVIIVSTVLFATYILIDPGEALARWMQLTRMPIQFRLFILALGVIGLASGWLAEQYFLPWTTRSFAHIRQRLDAGHKRHQKKYKTVLSNFSQ